MSNTSVPSVLAVLLAILIGVLAFFDVIELSKFKANITAETFTSLVLSLVAIALFIERSAEVYLSVWRRPERERLTSAVRDLNKEIDENKQILADIASGKRQGTPAEINAANDAIQLQTQASRTAAQDLADYRAVTASYSLTINVSLGLLVACIGARALEPLLAETVSLNGKFFVAVDVVITGALLGGGADGLHKIISVFTTWAEETKNKTKGI